MAGGPSRKILVLLVLSGCIECARTEAELAASEALESDEGELAAPAVDVSQSKQRKWWQPGQLDGAQLGGLVGLVVGWMITPDWELEAYPEFKARTVEAWRSKVKQRRPIPLADRMPAILRVAVLTSLCFDYAYNVHDFGPLGAVAHTRVGSMGVQLTQKTGRAARASWQTLSAAARFAGGLWQPAGSHRSGLAFLPNAFGVIERTPVGRMGVQLKRNTGRAARIAGLRCAATFETAYSATRLAGARINSMPPAPGPSGGPLTPYAS